MNNRIYHGRSIYHLQGGRIWIYENDKKEWIAPFCLQQEQKTGRHVASLVIKKVK